MSRDEFTKPDWDTWRLMPEVSISEAVALSCNIEPESVTDLHDAFISKTKEFDRRMKVALASTHGSGALKTDGMRWHTTQRVRLFDFAVWADGIGFDLPKEFPRQQASFDTSEQFSEEKHRNPRWNKWRLMPEIKIWEAVALSLNIEPEKIKTNRNAWMGAKHPFDEGQDFDDRLTVLSKHCSNREHFPTPCSLYLANRWQCEVRLDEFAVWCSNVGFDIPSELAALAKSHPESEKGLGVFKEMGISARELTVTLLRVDESRTPDRLRLSAGGVTRTVTFSEFGLMSKKDGLPNRSAKMLIGIVEGQIAANVQAPEQAMKELRGKFRDVVTDKDSFHPKENGYWKPKFTLKCQIEEADKRAKYRAERFTDAAREQYEMENDDAGKWLAKNNK